MELEKLKQQLATEFVKIVDFTESKYSAEWTKFVRILNSDKQQIGKIF